ncbi:MAG: hypothetical protein MI748_15525 [Opitutales bacterium]|nr:hypothetical protein [Opitutales bacterium]
MQKGNRIFYPIIGLIVIIGFLFRSSYIEERPVHADEAENSYLLGGALAGENYHFDPTHHHGPTLHYYLRVVTLFTGANSFRSLEIEPLRIGICVLGCLTLLGVAAFARYVGWVAIVASAILGVVSSYLTYYGNYVIHETLLGVFGIAWILVFWSNLKNPSAFKLASMGIITALLVATKLTAAILFLSWGLSILINKNLFREGWHSFLIKGSRWRGSLIVCFGFLTVFSLLYSDFFRNPTGVWDAVRTFWSYETQVGHEKPWFYYLSEFFLPFQSRPVWSHETGLLGFALFGGFWSMVRLLKKPIEKQDKGLSLGYFLVSSSVVQIVVYSVISYKSPWVLLVTWLQLLILAGLGFQSLWNSRGNWGKAGLALVFALLLFVQVRSTQYWNGTLHSHDQNPLAYVPTSKNVSNLASFLEGTFGDERIRVVGEYLWPLPWYLRRLPKVEYDEALQSIDDGDIFLLTDDSYEELPKKEVYVFLPYSLRPNFPIYLAVTQEKWSAINAKLNDR